MMIYQQTLLNVLRGLCDIFLSILQLSKTREIVPRENHQEVFVMLVVVAVLSLLEALRFQAIFPCHRDSTLASQPVKVSTSSELYPGYFRLLTFSRLFRH